jgi:hypothetical protein
MSDTATYQLPPPEQVRKQIAAAEDELKALRRLLRASVAAEKAEEARLRKGGVAHAG